MRPRDTEGPWAFATLAQARGSRASQGTSPAHVDARSGAPASLVRPGQGQAPVSRASPRPCPSCPSCPGRPGPCAPRPDAGRPFLPEAGAALPAAGAARAARPLRGAPGAGPLPPQAALPSALLSSSAPRRKPATSRRARSSEGGRRDAGRVRGRTEGAGSRGGGAGPGAAHEGEGPPVPPPPAGAVAPAAAVASPPPVPQPRLSLPSSLFPRLHPLSHVPSRSPLSSPSSPLFCLLSFRLPILRHPRQLPRPLLSCSPSFSVGLYVSSLPGPGAFSLSWVSVFQSFSTWISFLAVFSFQPCRSTSAGPSFLFLPLSPSSHSAGHRALQWGSGWGSCPFSALLPAHFHKGSWEWGYDYSSLWVPQGHTERTPLFTPSPCPQGWG